LIAADGYAFAAADAFSMLLMITSRFSPMPAAAARYTPLLIAAAAAAVFFIAAARLLLFRY